MKIELTCEICNTVYKVQPKREFISRTCSRKCADKLKSISMLGSSHPRYSKTEKECLICGKNFITTSSRERRSKTCSKVCDGKYRSKTYIGENGANWKGGLTLEKDRIRGTIEYRLWRDTVYLRDDFKCQKCGDNTGGNLNAHHILNFSKFPDLRFNISNGITLCSKCHNPAIKGSFHSIYGVRDNNDMQLNEYLGCQL